ncbi:hypothetical protein BGX34_006456 [Mortierella sp. NVP85]|nr:hypothetical protein BGX34_006456 [Mortierella sp. NVP85]
MSIANLDRLFRTANVDDEKTKKTTFATSPHRDVVLAVLYQAPDTYAAMCQYAEEEALTPHGRSNPGCQSKAQSEGVDQRSAEEISKIRLLTEIRSFIMDRILEGLDTKAVKDIFKTRYTTKTTT